MKVKIKRSLNKALRGEHEAVIARPSAVEKQESSDASTRSLAQSQLHDLTNICYMRESFEFLATLRLHHCTICDEAWPVFDGEWPQNGTHTAGNMAGECETIKKAGFVASDKAKDLCSRCAQRGSNYKKEYCKENLQHLGERNAAISDLTYYESLLVARVHPCITITTMLATGLLCFARHVVNYRVKTFEWFQELPLVLRDKKWFLIKRRKSLYQQESRSRQRKPTTANRERLEAAMRELLKRMPNVYAGSFIKDENLVKFPWVRKLRCKRRSASQISQGSCMLNETCTRNGWTKQLHQVQSIHVHMDFYTILRSC